MSPDDMDVKFLLFTCNNRDVSHNLTYLSESSDWVNAGYNASAITRFIVHGWLEQYPGSAFNYMEIMKDIFLNHSCVNVVAVDWSKPAKAVDYFQSAYNTRAVGQMIGCVINRLAHDLGVNPQDIHLVGHSLGGHVVGFAGKTVTDPKVGHITANDPAGPGFTGQPAKNRLAVGDATFVNVIHSNGIPPNGVPGLQGLGDLEALGNIDSYFNGAVLNLVLCSHVRSNNIAINDQSYGQSTGCQPIGYHCTSYDDFMNGLCGDCGSDGKACRPMELNLDYWDNKNNWDIIDTNNKFYINTGDARQSGYCLSHYQIVVSSGQSTCSGSLEIQLSDGSNVKMSLNSKHEIQTNDGNQHYATLHTVANPLPITTTATIKSQFGTNCIINEIKFNFMSNINESSHMPGIYLPIWRLKETSC
ncbi:unnamed protein product [Medioppia subpectinata]|uniref:Lipase domain-containing protein n=1 Tax=Medioppia subpectinata TaxID=1979941 RepID=A0A7R9L448_9ACAR|nr:unnamed protein product [Medioppia subpectinata]CAG2114968.1 unnamed protein product [Medioppia subpectinata]